MNQMARVVNAIKSLFLFAFLPSLIPFYGGYFLVFPGYQQQKKYLLSIGSGILISLSASSIGYILIRFSIESGFKIDLDKRGKNGRSAAFILLKKS
jgi:two-component system, LytTR family, sensor kinase